MPEEVSTHFEYRLQKRIRMDKTCDSKLSLFRAPFRISLSFRLISFVLLILFCLVFYKEKKIERPSGPFSEGCIFCHNRVTDPDPSHGISGFGCYSCHLGNAYSFDKARAHWGMVLNPGDLRFVERTCGRPGCHAEIAQRVKNSLMATNSGILRILNEKWGGHEGSMGVRDLLVPNPPYSLALDQYRKMCGACHLWKPRGKKDEGEIGRRGGGCSDCHVLDEAAKPSQDPGTMEHPKMTTRIPSKNCVKCHNRSARIGLSYFGRFESEGYGTPYEGREFSQRRLSGNRYYIEMHEDIHWSKAGMDCIDCHTATEVMGDGRSYDRMEDQRDIACTDCHDPRLREGGGDALAGRLKALNKKVPAVEGKRIGYTRRGTPLYTLQEHEGEVFFFRKRDGHLIPMDLQSGSRPHHRLKGHERLSCQACHSAWMPQCYGCHMTYVSSEAQWDWIAEKGSPGRWKEARSYLRFSRPSLGVRGGASVYPLSPCQVFFHYMDDKDQFQDADSFTHLTVSAFDPHSTQKTSRTCIDCHGDPKTLGLGEGILNRKRGEWVFRPTYDSARSGLGTSLPIDGFCGLDGAPSEWGKGDRARPFNPQELARVMTVNPCLSCHSRYEDLIYQDFRTSLWRFEHDKGLPCQRD